MNKNHTIPAVLNTLRVIEFIAGHPGGLPRSEIVRELKIPVSNAYRIVQSLLAAGWVFKNESGRFELSATTVQKLHSTENHLQRLLDSQYLLDGLAHTTMLSAKISVREGGEQLSLLRAEPPLPMVISGKNGSRFPIIEGSVGAALLFQESKKNIAALCKNAAPEVAAQNTPELISRRIQDIKDRHFTLNPGIGRWKLYAMSAPILFDGHVAGAVTLVGMENDFSPEQLDSLSSKLNAFIEELQYVQKN